MIDIDKANDLEISQAILKTINKLGYDHPLVEDFLNDMSREAVFLLCRCAVLARDESLVEFLMSYHDKKCSTKDDALTARQLIMTLGEMCGMELRSWE